MLRVGIGVVVAYVGVLVVLALLESWFLYHPTPYTKDWQEPPPSLRAQDVTFESSDGTRIHAWWCPTENWRPEHGALHYSHGNAGNLSHRAEGVRRWQTLMNQAVLIYDYPGYGKSEGKPSEAGCHASAEGAYRWLVEEQKVPGERILLYGGSLGGAMAVDLAFRHPHRGVVLHSAFTSIPDMAQKQFPFLPARWLVRHRFDNLAKIGQVGGPVFITHGTADSLVPFSQGERLFAAAAEPKCFFPLEGHDHNHAPSPEFYSRLRDFLAEVEAPTSPSR